MNHKPQIIPVVSPQIDWGLFVDAVQSLTGKSPTRSLDREGIRPEGSSAFLKALEEFSQQPGDWLEHQLSFGFLIELTLTQYIQILRRTKLKTVDNCSDYSKVVLVGGTLYEWREACLEFCSENVDIVLRYIFDYIYLYLHHLKLLTLHKTMLKDQTFVLEDQR